jgi:hypothetical protein
VAQVQMAGIFGDEIFGGGLGVMVRNWPILLKKSLCKVLVRICRNEIAQKRFLRRRRAAFLDSGPA